MKGSISMYILGISGLYHDSAAALVCNGEIIAAAQEERFTRVKHDANIPVNAMRYCLRQGGIKASELKAVVYYDQPLLTLDRFLKNSLALGDDAGDLVDHVYNNLFSRKIWLHKQIENPKPRNPKVHLCLFFPVIGCPHFAYSPFIVSIVYCY